MQRIKFVFILSAFLIIFGFKASFAYASDQSIQISPDLSLTFSFPFLINKTSNSSLFSFFPSEPDSILLIQPESAYGLTTPSTSLNSLTTPVILDPTETPTPTPTVTPTKIPTPTATPTPLITSTIAPTISDSLAPFNPPPGSLNADKIFDLVNIHRQNMGLPANIKNDRVCAVAQSRAPELANEFATGNLHQGIRARHLPYWNHENIISTKSEQAAVDGWLSDDIHRKGIEGDYKYTCVACWTNKCVQEFTNLVNK